MKVEIVSIGTELLVSDILDTNSAFVSRSLREVKVDLTCKVTVGDDPDMIADAFRTALRRADVVISTGGLGTGRDDFTRQAVTAVTGREWQPDSPGIVGARLLGDASAHMCGFLMEEDAGVLICLPGNRREMSFLLETEVLPYLRQQIHSETKNGWALLRSVGLMESNLKQELADLATDPQHRVTFDSFAGQTNIRLWVQANSDEEVKNELHRMTSVVRERLGDHIYGAEADRLEEIVLNALIQNGVKLSLLECYTNQIMADTLNRLPGSNKVLNAMPWQTWFEAADKLHLEAVTQNNLTQWSRAAAEKLVELSGDTLGLVVYSYVTQGGVQILVTLVSPNGASVTQRSFGGHPESIDQWALTLGLSHLRRWLLVHY
ncbi:MAG TPA: molybdopterin-binding protein [Chloroflexota bacterium]|nr:molybdopterin-binding protein [Chloroflexota bacterium]